MCVSSLLPSGETNMWLRTPTNPTSLIILCTLMGVLTHVHCQGPTDQCAACMNPAWSAGMWPSLGEAIQHIPEPQAGMCRQEPPLSGWHALATQRSGRAAASLLQGAAATSGPSSRWGQGRAAAPWLWGKDQTRPNIANFGILSVLKQSRVHAVCCSCH